MKNKRGQLTLFVLLAIVFVVFVFLYFYWIHPTYVSRRIAPLDFNSCVQQAFQESLVTLSLTGGVISPDFYYSYKDNKVPYYCYTNLAYRTCVIQRPMVKQGFEREFIDFFSKEINECYQESIEELREKGYEVREGDVLVNLSIIPKKVNIDIHAPTTIEARRFVDYRFSFDSSIYDILMIATSILQYEANYGDAPTSEFMFYYPYIIVDKFKQGDSTTIYVISDKNSEIKFQFASRSLIWPAGYDVVSYV